VFEYYAGGNSKFSEADLPWRSGGLDFTLRHRWGCTPALCPGIFRFRLRAGCGGRPVGGRELLLVLKPASQSPLTAILTTRATPRSQAGLPPGVFSRSCRGTGNGESAPLWLPHPLVAQNFILSTVRLDRRDDQGQTHGSCRTRRLLNASRSKADSRANTHIISGPRRPCSGDIEQCLPASSPLSVRCFRQGRPRIVLRGARAPACLSNPSAVFERLVVAIASAPPGRGVIRIASESAWTIRRSPKPHSDPLDSHVANPSAARYDVRDSST